MRDYHLFNRTFWSGIIKILSATGFTLITTFIMVGMVPLLAGDKGFITLSTKILIIILPTLAVHVLVSHALGLEEAKPVVTKLKQIVLKPIKI